MRGVYQRLLWTTTASWTPTQQKRIFDGNRELPEDLEGWLALAREKELPDSRLDAFRERWASLENDSRVEKAFGKGIDALITNLFERDRELFGRQDLPPVLFFRGNPNVLGQPGIAIVGARKATPYGREIARQLATEAVRNGKVVVSGAAYGIDAAAHRAALDAGGRTVAVMGCGLLHDYPKEHAELLDRIAENGLVVSQFPPEISPLGRNFVIRNRLIAALSRDVVIVEGANRSGARHTADFAVKLKRRLWAVPGELGKVNSGLPLQLLERGARLISSVRAPFETKEISRTATQISFFSETPEQAPVSDDIEPPKDEIGRKILNLLASRPLSVDELVTRLTLPPAKVSTAITFLELEGWIEKGSDGCYHPRRSLPKVGNV